MEYKYNKITLSINGDDLENEKNFITVDDEKLFIYPLKEEFLNSKGGNSNVFKLIDNKTNIEKAIKFSNYFRPKTKKESKRLGKRYNRFLSEIKALYEVKDKYENIIQIDFDGIIEINNKEFPYYVMEKADTDLKEYLHEHQDLDLQERFRLCRDIFHAIKNLHKEEIYHRDIKPDNVLLFLNDETFKWKIGDLGLIQYRDTDYDDIGEKIGPYGWLSPEAMNKFLTEESSLNFDCCIDNQSDIFMLGKLFWFIFNLNAPIGLIKESDFKTEFSNSSMLFDLISQMLCYSKSIRATTPDIEYYIDHIAKELYI